MSKSDSETALTLYWKNGEIYTQARIEAKRQAQQRLVQTILTDESDELAPEIQGRSDVTMT